MQAWRPGTKGARWLPAVLLLLVLISIYCLDRLIDHYQNTMCRHALQAAIATTLINVGIAQHSSGTSLGPTAYTVSAGFPTSAFSSYYVKPAATVEPQPILHDPVLNITFPLNLTSPDTIPTVDNDPVFYPKASANLSDAAAASLVQAAIVNISNIIQADGGASNCTKCQQALAVAKSVALVAPTRVPGMLVSLCEKFQFESNATCVDDYAATNTGAIWTQVLAFADVTGLDGKYICNDLSKSFCPAPTVSPLNTTNLFPKPKPANAVAPAASGERIKVLHLSDFHLDPRYTVKAEANCTGYLCCRPNVHAEGYPLPQIELPAPLYGAYSCDTPYYLGLAALQSIGPLTGTQGNSTFAW